MAEDCMATLNNHDGSQRTVQESQVPWRVIGGSSITLNLRRLLLTL